MSEPSDEQNKSEEATPFKLRRAREKGQVARGMDLGYFGALAALAAFLIVAGSALGATLMQVMRGAFTIGMANASDPQQAGSLLAALYWPAFQPILLFAGTIVAMVLLLEVVQLRGFMFSSHPLKPDFSRINPAKGMKRIFSARTAKEAAKNVLKFAAYAIVAYLVIRAALASPGRARADADGLAHAMQSGAMRMLLLFILLALFFAALDQIIARRQYGKQMRMSRRELTRESKEREGDPRQKQKRKQLHGEFARERGGLGDIGGADLLVVNPEHLAIALAYDAAAMAAPRVRAKARNRFAQAMKREAFRLGIPMFEERALARALWDECDKGAEIGERHYRVVADLYTRLGSRNSNWADET